MRKSTYDVVSTIAVVSLVVFTVAAQRSSRGAYAFGVLAVLAAAGLFAAYVKGLGTPSVTDGATERAEAARQPDGTRQGDKLTRTVGPDFERAFVRQLARRKLLKERAREQREDDDVVGNTVRMLEIQAYHTQIKFHHAFYDPASTIVNIVEKLCAGSDTPRFEFVLEPDGKFKIQQISAKHALAAPVAQPKSEQQVEGVPQDAHEGNLVN